jgi:Zn-finger nucleic acid-binding protein
MARGTYEELPVLRCSDCRGHLVDSERAQAIKRRLLLTAGELQAEAIADEQPDSASLLPCPRCRRRMTKQRVHLQGEIQLDLCDQCRFIWFDGGELSLWQLAHENTEQGREAAELQRRHREMTDEQRAELQQHLDRLPEAPTVLGTLFEGILEGLFTRRWRVSRHGPF